MKAVKEKLPADRVAEFEKGAQAFAKKIVTNFKDYEFVGFSHLFYPHWIPTRCSSSASPWTLRVW
jgi:hypothetical protein